jgi:acetyl esterase/lipase
MLNSLRAGVLKFFLNAADFSGRLFIYNREMPAIGEHQNNIPYGDHPNQKVDLLLPRVVSCKPGIVYVHGGGWLIGNKASYRRVCAQWAARGFPVVNVNYRLGPAFTYRDQVSDINQAIKLAQQLFNDNGFSSDNLVLAGDSAGAHLTSWYTTVTRKPELASWAGIQNTISAEAIRALILIYGAYDLETSLTSGFAFIKTFYHAFLGKNPSKQEIDHLSPLRHIQADFPRTFVFALESDALVNESFQLIKKFELLGVPHQPMVFTREEYPYARHGLINVYTMSFAQHAMREMIKFLNDLPAKK